MMGKKTGVSTQIKKDVQPLSLCIHCYAHFLKLACSDWLKNSQVSKSVAKSLSTSFEITKIVKYSLKRDSYLRKIQKIQAQEETERECSKASTVRLFSETRWTVRAKSLESIYENYEALEDLWDWSSQNKDRETKARVGDVQAQMRTFESFFGLRLGILILRHSDNLSASIQAKDLYAAKAKHTANKTLATIKKLRTDQSFELLDISRVGKYIYKRAFHLLPLQPKIQFSELPRIVFRRFYNADVRNFYAPQIMSLKYLVRFWIPDKYVTGQLFLLLRNKLQMVDRILAKHLRRH